MSPKLDFLADLYERLTDAGLTVYWTLPDPSVPEPFAVISTSSDDDNYGNKVNNKLENTLQQIDLFLSGNLTREEVEQEVFKAKKALAGYKVSARTLMDDTTGRQVYHVIFMINTTIKY